jgi:hypothetical protein
MRIVQKDISGYKDLYLRDHCVRLPSFLNPLALDLLRDGFKYESDKRPLLKGVSSEITIIDKIICFKLQVMLNDPEYLDALSILVGKKVCRTTHRLYYNDVTCAHLPWHDDSIEKDLRIASIRFELSESPYEGGEFLFRSSDNKERVFKDLKFGEAVLFEIEYGKYEHMVTPVTQGQRRSLSMFLHGE